MTDYYAWSERASLTKSKIITPFDKDKIVEVGACDQIYSVTSFVTSFLGVHA